MRNRGIRRRRAKRNYVDFAELDEPRPAVEHPVRAPHEIRSNAQRRPEAPTLNVDPSVTG